MNEMKNTEKNGRTLLTAGIVLLALFAAWTAVILTVDVRPVGAAGTRIGLAALNTRFHERIGVHERFYTLTDWLGLVPILVCMIFFVIGLAQLIGRRRFFLVDCDLWILGVYYLLVIAAYLIFERLPINYRPILIEGRLETSYPSSTTLLVLSVMPTLCFEAHRRLPSPALRGLIDLFSAGFSLFMVIGRTVSGVHWLSDIIGSVFLSAGLFLLYHGCVTLADGKTKRKEQS